MKKRQRFEMVELVQEIQMIIDDWHRTKCPKSYISCEKTCPHYKLCSSLLVLSQIKVQYYDSNGELKNEYL